MEKILEERVEEDGRTVWHKFYRCNANSIIERLIDKGFRCEKVSMKDAADVGMKMFGGRYSWDEFCELYPEVRFKAAHIIFYLPDDCIIYFSFFDDETATLSISRVDLELEDFLSTDRKIDWNSGLLDEINLVYEKVGANEKIQLLLTELEIFALQEAMEACQKDGILSKKNRGAVLTQEEFLKLPEIDKETAIVMLGEDGLDYGKDGMSAFSINRQTATITVNFSQLICETHACTTFDVLNRLEKIDGTNNVGGASNWTLELHAPAEAEKKIALWNYLIEQLYPWITVKVCLSKEAVKTAVSKGAAKTIASKETAKAAEKKPKLTDRAERISALPQKMNNSEQKRIITRKYILSVIFTLVFFVGAGLMSFKLATSSDQIDDPYIGWLGLFWSVVMGGLLILHFTNTYRRNR